MVLLALYQSGECARTSQRGARVTLPQPPAPVLRMASSALRRDFVFDARCQSACASGAIEM